MRGVPAFGQAFIIDPPLRYAVRQGDLLKRKLAMKDIERHSTLTCPHCGHRSRDRMPVDACQFFYDCPGCGALLRPLPGDCCVYCSYGDVKCPPVQAGQGCCA